MLVAGKSGARNIGILETRSRIDAIILSEIDGIWITHASPDGPNKVQLMQMQRCGRGFDADALGRNRPLISVAIVVGVRSRAAVGKAVIPTCVFVTRGAVCIAHVDPTSTCVIDLPNCRASCRRENSMGQLSCGGWAM